MNTVQIDDYRLQQQQKYKQQQEILKQQIKQQEEEEMKKANAKPPITNVLGGIKANQLNALQKQDYESFEEKQIEREKFQELNEMLDLEKQNTDEWQEEELAYQRIQKELLEKDEQLARQLQNAEEYALFQGQFQDLNTQQNLEAQRVTSPRVLQNPILQQPLLQQDQTSFNKKKLFLLVSLLLVITAVIVISLI